MTLDWSKYPNFSAAECGCSCGCGKLPPESLMDRLQALRTELGFPLAVSSGARCAARNKAVSSTGENGPHTRGAVDILATGAQALVIVQKALEMGFSGIGVKQSGPHGSRFIHLDVLENEPGQPRPWIWSYP